MASVRFSSLSFETKEVRECMNNQLFYKKSIKIFRLCPASVSKFFEDIIIF